MSNKNCDDCGEFIAGEVALCPKCEDANWQKTKESYLSKYQNQIREDDDFYYLQQGIPRRTVKIIAKKNPEYEVPCFE